MNSIKTRVVSTEILNSSCKSSVSINEKPAKSEVLEIDKKLTKTGDAVYPSIIERRSLAARTGSKLSEQDMARMSEEAILNMRLPEESVKEYAKKILSQKKEKEDEEIKFKEALEAQQKIEIERAKKQKIVALKSLRDRMKEENAMQAEFKKHLLEEKQRRESQAVIQKRLMDKKQDEASQLEMHRLRQLQDSKELQEQLENLRYTDVLRYHEQKIRTLKGRTEYLEIIRREEEEQRMRYLEGRRKMIEDRIASKIAQEEADKLAAIKHTADIRDRMQARVRMGNFKWHGGQLGFYDGVRLASVDWIEYEDSEGKPFYYDPVYQQSQYRKPVDAEIVHHVVLERAEYDGIYGEGAYDLRQAEIKVKDEYNRLGGSYDHNGVFHRANGYWDENYEWVPYEGYVNEKGRFVKFAKVEGDLSFMV